MFLNLMPQFDFHNIRWTGTLQRIAIVFCISAIIYLNTNWKQQAWLAAILLVLYWLALTCIPTPGIGKVMLEPGVNIVAWFDTKFLPGRMWRGTWDPESILTNIPSVVNCITGMLAGRLPFGWVLLVGRPDTQRFQRHHEPRVGGGDLGFGRLGNRFDQGDRRQRTLE